MTPVKIIGKKMVLWAEEAGLLVVAVSTLIAIIMEVNVMIQNGHVAIADLLLMFIYLEVLAMVGIYLESEKLPVRYPLYIAIVALARYLMLDMKSMDTGKMLSVAGSAFIISLTILAIRFGHIRFPYKVDETIEENDQAREKKNTAKKR